MRETNVLASAGMAQIDGANANATAREAWKVMPELLVRALNCAYSLAVGIRPGHIYPFPMRPRSLRSYGPPTRWHCVICSRTSDAPSRTRVTWNLVVERPQSHLLNLVISRLTSADISLLRDEGRNMPWHYNNVRREHRPPSLIGMDALHGS